MRKFIIALTILLCFSSYQALASPPGFIAGVTTPAAGGAAFYETFDATGYDNSTVGDWTETGTPNEDCSTDPCPLVGTQSLSVTFTQTAKTKNISGITGASSWEFVFRAGSLENAGDMYIAKIVDSSGTGTQTGTAAGTVYIRAADTIRVKHGTTAALGSTVILVDTTYHAWVDYTPASVSPGSDGVMSVFIAPYTGSETKPETPASTTSVGTSTSVAVSLVLCQHNSDSGQPVYFDNAVGNPQ